MQWGDTTVSMPLFPAEAFNIAIWDDSNATHVGFDISSLYGRYFICSKQQWGLFQTAGKQYNVVLSLPYQDWYSPVIAVRQAATEMIGYDNLELNNFDITTGFGDNSERRGIYLCFGKQQWGYSAFIYGGKKVTFPIPYIAQCYGVVSQNIQTTTDFIVCAINDVDTTGFWDSNGSYIGIYWFAFGK